MDFAHFTRLAAIVLTPSNLLLWVLVAGALLMLTRRHQRLGKGLVFLVTLALLLIFFLPLHNWLATPLENRFPRPPLPAHVDGFLVLGGGENAAVFAARHAPAASAETGRLVAAAELSRRYPDAKLIFTGGRAPFESGRLTEAQVARALLVQMGVPRDRIILESRSRNTWENFLFSKQIAQPKPGQTWLVVTSAMHMPRAMGIAAELHWHVLPWPAGYTTTGRPGRLSWNDSLAGHLGALEGVLHEWAGIFVYRLTGRWTEPPPEPVEGR